MKNEDGIASDVDVYVASMPGKPEEVAIASIAFNNTSHAQTVAEALRSALEELKRIHGAFTLVMDERGAFISFVESWHGEVVDGLFEGIARDLNVSISVDRVSRSVAQKLYLPRR